jgi:hypothetical protein
MSLTGESPRVPVRIWISGPETAPSGRSFSPGQSAPAERHGWGFFLTTRTGEPEKGKLWCFVDLYLYSEGQEVIDE